MMKKYLLSLGVLIFSASAAMAQVTIAHDTVHYYGFPKDGNSHILKDSIINNTAAAATITWAKTGEQLLTGWTGVGICDIVTCYPWGASINGSFTLNPGQKALVYVDMQALTTAADGSSYITVTTNYGDMVYKFTSWANSVKDLENNSIVTIYPNPATNFINIGVLDSRVRSLNILNVVGRKVAKFDIDNSTPNPIRIPLEGVADGVYLLQFADANGKLLGVRRVTKN